MQIVIFWFIRNCILSCGYKYFGGKFCLRLQVGNELPRARIHNVKVRMSTT
jgi:hypothetical protein